MSGVLQFFYEAGQRYYDLSLLSDECYSQGDPPAADLIIDYKKCNLPFVLVNHGTLVLLIIIISILLREFKLIEKALYWIPESVIVLLLGLIVGFLTQAAGAPPRWISITQAWVKFGFLPPIILSSAYQLYDKNFFNQFFSILLLAIIGTVTAINGITLSLKANNSLELAAGELQNPSMWDYYKFGTTVSSVDPITVLSIFNTANVDRGLYFLVFGESAFNDGVAYALFKGFKKVDDWAILKFNQTGEHSEVSTETYVYLSLSFIVGPILSVLFAFMVVVASSLLTKIMTRKSQIFSPFLVLGCVWTGFYISDFIGLSPIIFALICGLGQIRYTFPNLPPAHQLTIRLVLNTIANIYQLCIFLFLGVLVSFIDIAAYWQLILLTTFIMYVWRCVVIMGMGLYINKFTKSRIHWKWQIILCVGSLRGIMAIAMSKENDGEETVFQDICLALIFVTVLINGIAIKPLVIILGLQAVENKLPEDVNDVQEEEVPTKNKWKKMVAFEKNHVQRILCKNEKERYPLMTTYQIQTVYEGLNNTEFCESLKAEGYEDVESNYNNEENLVEKNNQSIDVDTHHENKQDRK